MKWAEYYLVAQLHKSWTLAVVRCKTEVKTLITNVLLAPVPPVAEIRQILEVSITWLFLLTSILTRIKWLIGGPVVNMDLDDLEKLYGFADLESSGDENEDFRKPRQNVITMDDAVDDADDENNGSEDDDSSDDDDEGTESMDNDENEEEDPDNEDNGADEDDD